MYGEGGVNSLLAPSLLERFFPLWPDQQIENMFGSNAPNQVI